MKSRLIAFAVVLAVAGCGDRAVQGRDSTATVAAVPSANPPIRPSVVFLGTSLTAGLGVDPAQAYPAVIQRMADSAGLQLQVENRGNSGETSAGARARLDWILQHPPAMLVIETGANDGLRGQDPDSTKANIRAIIQQVRARDSTTRIAIIAMEAMPNLGRRYVTAFRAIYPTLAREQNVTLVPFLLDGVAGVDSLNQADGIHPTPRGHRIVAENIWRALRSTLTEVGQPRSVSR